MKEKLAASLILLRLVLLPGLFVDKKLFESGGGGVLETAVSSVLLRRSGGSEVPSASSDSLSNTTNAHRSRDELNKGVFDTLF